MRILRPIARPFHLRELNLAAGCDLLLTVAHARQYDANWLAAAFAQFSHGADLPGRGVRPQQDLGVGRVESILHIPAPDDAGGRLSSVKLKSSSSTS